MLRGCLSVLRAPSRAPSRTLVPVRNWNQCTMFLSTPPRNPLTLGECIAHSAFMMVVWLAPMLLGFTQIKVWRRTYLEST